MGLAMAFDCNKWAYSFYGVVDERFAVETDLFQLHIHRKEGIKKLMVEKTLGKLDIYVPDNMDLELYRSQEKMRKLMVEEVNWQASQIFRQRTDVIASRLNIGHIEIRTMKYDTHAGYNCNAYLKFNIWTICGRDSRLVDYLICHELAHFYKSGHCKPFWRIVDMIYLGLDDESNCTGEISLGLDKEFRYNWVPSEMMHWSSPSTLKHWYENGWVQNKWNRIR